MWASIIIRTMVAMPVRGSTRTGSAVMKCSTVQPGFFASAGICQALHIASPCLLFAVVLRSASTQCMKSVVERTPKELQSCHEAASDTTLMVWADCDDNCSDGEALKAHFWKEAQRQGIAQAQFDRIVFIFAKDRIENWIEFLLTGNTDESKEGPRVKNNREAAEAAKKLADWCKAGKPVNDMPPSLQWSCRNWRELAARMR